MTFEAVKVKKMHAFEKVLGCSAMFFSQMKLYLHMVGCTLEKKAVGKI